MKRHGRRSVQVTTMWSSLVPSAFVTHPWREHAHIIRIGGDVVSQAADDEVREGVAADFRKALGLDLTDRERAAWIRARTQVERTLIVVYEPGTRNVRVLSPDDLHRPADADALHRASDMLDGDQP